MDVGGMYGGSKMPGRESHRCGTKVNPGQRMSPCWSRRQGYSAGGKATVALGE